MTCITYGVQENQTQITLVNVAIPLSRTYEYTFERPGAYTVTCDVHTDMQGSIFVTATPFAAIADSDGRFTLPDVVPGSYKVTVLTGGHQTARVGGDHWRADDSSVRPVRMFSFVGGSTYAQLQAL